MISVLPWVLRLLAVAVVAAGFALACACGGDGEPIPTPSVSTEEPSGGEPSAEPHPGTWTWEPTGQYRTDRMGVGLTVHTFVTTPDYIVIVCSLDHPTPGSDGSTAVVTLTDDLGQSYDVVSNAMLGSTLGVTAGVLTVEPYKGEGKRLTLTVSDVTTSSGGAAPGETVAGELSVTFIENLEPGAPVDYTEGGRIAPAVVRAGEITIGMGGPSPQPVVELLVYRGGREGALYGGISDGVTGPLTKEEFHEQLKAYTGGVDDYPPPEGWPAPAEVP